MSMRIKKKDLEAKERHVNQLLDKIKLKVCYRYNYVAIDILKEGRVYDTLVAGLTKKQAYQILDAIDRVLLLNRFLKE